MNGQLEQSEERYYAIERLAQLQGQIVQLVQGMVIQRARVEKYRQEDLAAARESYSELQQVRRQLCHSISEAQPLLMETEEYRTAATAEKLRIGLSGFDLMSNIYRPVYDAITAFAQAFPVNRTANAATVGRLMNHIRMGYYPTDPENISLILRGIRFPDGVITNLLDPCCGCGKALRQIAQGNGCYTYGMELDESRAEEAQTRLHRVGFGSFFHSAVSHEAFHLLFLNPPYLSVLNESGSRARHEKRFLIESLSCLTYGGLLIYIAIYFEGKGFITKWDGAEDSDIEPVKGGLSDSMKRAAVQWGIGRVLYSMDTVWVDIEKRGKSYVIKDSERQKLDKTYLGMLQQLGLTPAPAGGLQALLTPTKTTEAAGTGTQTQDTNGQPPATELSASAKKEQPSAYLRQSSAPARRPAAQPAYEYVVVDAKVQGGMRGSSTLVTLEDSGGKRTQAFARGARVELSAGVCLTSVKLTLHRQDTVAYYVLENYELATMQQAA